MKINYNVSAAMALNSLNRNDNRLQTSMTRLSSGFKINFAKDNPAGLAMAKRMNSQLEGISQATLNAGDGVSVIEIADGTMSEIHEMLQRINELAVKACTGTITDGDREMIDNEVQQLKEEITRISNETEFNGQKILDGSFDLKGYTDNPDVKVVYYSDAVVAGNYELELEATLKKDNAGNVIEPQTIDTATFTQLSSNDVSAVAIPNDIAISLIDGNIITLKGSNDFELRVRVTKDINTAGNPVIMKLEGFGAMDQQIGANEGQQIPIRIPKVSLENMGISAINMKTEESSTDALERMDGAIKYVSSVRGRLGAYQNRLEHTISSLDITNENLTAAYSRIMDTDMAEEMTEYTTMQVLAQASTSMLAQANERPSQVLQLLQ